MKSFILDFDKFDSANINGTVENADYISSSITKEISKSCKSGFEISKFENISVVNHNDICAKVSVYKFKVSDYNGDTFDQYKSSDSDYALIAAVKFYNNGNLVSDMSDDLNHYYCAVYPIEKEGGALYQVDYKLRKAINNLYEKIRDLMSDPDPLIDYIKSHLPEGSDVANESGTCGIFMSGKVPVKDYLVDVIYYNGKLTSIIHHKYTMTDRVYGTEFNDYCVEKRFKSKEEIDSFNWDSLWDDLYTHRNGTVRRHGSLGS